MYLIRSGTVVTAEKSIDADVLVEGEKVVKIGKNLSFTDAKTIDASGKFILPGGIDPHTHFDLPMFDTVSSDDHYTGHKAAAFGGTTTVMDFIPQPDEGKLADGVAEWRGKADPKAAIDFGFHMNINRLDEEIEKEIPKLLEHGIPTLKVFTAYNGKLRLEDDEIFRVLKIAKEHNMLTMVHAENGDVIEELVAEFLADGKTDPIWHARSRPGWLAVEAVLRMAALAAEAKASLYVVHMNTAGGVEMLNYARQQGVRVMGETCPQYLFFNEEHLSRPDGAKWICSPPMRTKTDNTRLWKALIENEFQVLGTDHCPFFYDGTTEIDYEGSPIAIPGKELGKDDFTKIPNGLPAVQDRLLILWTRAVSTGEMTPNQFVALTSTNAAKIFGLYPQKGTIAEGSDADLVIWDPEKKIKYGVAQSHHRTDYNLFEGWELIGYPEKVFLRGNLIVDGEEWHGKAGLGKFLHRVPNGEFI